MNVEDLLSDMAISFLSRRTWQVPLISRFIDNADSDEGQCVQIRKSTCARRIDLEGVSGESFLVFNR